jgi:hypothetical protein
MVVFGKCRQVLNCISGLASASFLIPNGFKPISGGAVFCLRFALHLELLCPKIVHPAGVVKHKVCYGVSKK